MSAAKHDESVKAWIRAERQAVVAESALHAYGSNASDGGPTKLHEEAKALRARADDLFRAIPRKEGPPKLDIPS
jgi:hypothetical protein